MIEPNDFEVTPTETPRLSPSVASILLRRSPLHAWHYHRLLGGVRREPTASMENGTLLHHLVLVGGDSDKLAIIDAENFRTKAAQELRDAARAAGKTPIIASQHAAATNAAAVIRKRIDLFGIPINEWEAERKMTWGSSGVACSGILDATTKTCVYELKSTDDAHPRNCRRSIEMYDYHVQAAAYREATGLPVVFLFAESDAPNDVTMIDDIAELAEIGERRWNRAKAIWKRCLETGDWPGAGGGRPVRVEASTYALSEDNEAAQNE